MPSNSHWRSRQLAVASLLVAGSAPALADACSSAQRNLALATSHQAQVCPNPGSAACAPIASDVAARARTVLSRCMGRLGAGEYTRITVLAQSGAGQRAPPRRCQTADGYIGPNTGSEFGDGMYRLMDQTDFFQNHLRYQVIQAHRRSQCQGGS